MFFLKFSESINIPIVQIVRFGTVGFDDEVERHSMNMKLQRYSFCASGLWAKLQFLVGPLLVSFLTVNVGAVDKVDLGRRSRRRMGEYSAAHLLRAVLFSVSSIFFLFIGQAHAETTVPFVGCPGFGMSSPSAPSGPPFKVDFPESIASKLALYAGEHLAILAPRGWSCSGRDTPTSQSLDIYPRQNSSVDEPSVIISDWLAEDSGAILTIGSFGGAYFKAIIPHGDIPGYVANAHEVDRSITTSKQFLVPKFPHDQIKYLNNSFFEFSTPASVEGLGDVDMYNFLLYKVNSPSNYPITGLAKLINYPRPAHLLFIETIKLDKNFEYLAPYIRNLTVSCLSKSLDDFCLSRASYSDQ